MLPKIGAAAKIIWGAQAVSLQHSAALPNASCAERNSGEHSKGDATEAVRGKAAANYRLADCATQSFTDSTALASLNCDLAQQRAQILEVDRFG
jgi:hypothetical protein